MTTAKRYNTVSLDNLSSAVQEHTDIDISNKDTVSADQITIIKRDGRKEPFMPEKMNKVCVWACGGRDYLAEELIADTKIKLHKEIHIKDMFQQLIVTAVNKISMLQPIWEEVAAKLKIMQIYKETYNIQKEGEYPHLKDVLAKGIQHKIYDKNTIGKYSEQEVEELNANIKPERDFLFNYKGIVTFFDKYCLNYTKTKTLELPQISYMRIAMALMVNEKERVKRCLELYNSLSKHNHTKATPIMLNSLTPGQQLSSCVLNTLADDSHSILDVGKDLGIYSKFKGGTALDITAMRAGGSYIEGTQGFSSGPTPFMKFYEAIMKAWNQGGKRPGALCVYFSWWHYDVFNLLSLKSNGGTDENRARGLKYGMKIHQFMVDAWLNDEEIYLFDPKETPELVGKVGEEFNALYKMYSEKTNIRKRKVKARELVDKLFKERSETGNIYLFHEENINHATLLNRYIGSSNLCTEIVLPSRPSRMISEELVRREDGTTEIVKRYDAGEIALCNLSSYNLEKWFYMNEQEKMDLCRIVVRSLDNTVDVANYPVKEGKHSNQMYRYLGIGVLNFANYLALKGIVIDTQEALEEQDRLFEEISYMTIKASCELAIEKGKFEKFYETEWSKGILPIHKANKKAMELTKHEPNWEKWNELSEMIKKFGIRNAQLLATAPTATSGKAVNATESSEPITDFFYKEEGTIIVPTLVPNFKKNNRYYKRAHECDQFMLIKGAGVRQKWWDQTQSVNVYVKRPDSLQYLAALHFYGFSIGMKTFYYLHQQKEMEEACESCT